MLTAKTNLNNQNKNVAQHVPHYLWKWIDFDKWHKNESFTFVNYLADLKLVEANWFTNSFQI